MSGALLRTRPAATAAMLALFDDAAVIAHALAFEAALAEAQVDAGVLHPSAASAIVAACATIAIDPAMLAEDAATAGTLAIPLVAYLRAALAGEAAEAVHRGATSQDVADTILMLQARDATALLLVEIAAITQALDRLARHHAATPAMGRTLLQDALPIGFGLRIAQWHAGIAAAAARLADEAAAGIRLQFGGAAGARHGLDGKGERIAAHMAATLGLRSAPPSHARRDAVAGLAAALGILVGMLGKMARDISLLAQAGIGEAREPAIAGRGGSSAMPHKRNPTGCQIALSAAIRAPGLVAAALAGLPQEEERGLGGWQAEGPVLTDLFLLAAGSAHAMVEVAGGLEIDTRAIARNLGDAFADIGESVAIVDALLAIDPKGR